MAGRKSKNEGALSVSKKKGRRNSKKNEDEDEEDNESGEEDSNSISQRGERLNSQNAGNSQNGGTSQRPKRNVTRRAIIIE